MLHRDPVRTVASSASFSATSRPDSLSSADFDGYYGPMWVDVLGTMVDRLVDYRDRMGDDRFYDLHYRELVGDPVGAVASDLRALRRDAEPGSREPDACAPGRAPARASTARTRTPSPTSDSHETEVRDRFAAYCERFDVEAEP